MSPADKVQLRNSAEQRPSKICHQHLKLPHNLVIAPGIDALVHQERIPFQDRHTRLRQRSSGVGRVMMVFPHSNTGKGSWPSVREE